MPNSNIHEALAPEACLTLLLEDEQHRTANEIASAIAALRLGDRSVIGPSLVRQAIASLENYAKLRRILCSSSDRDGNLVAALRALVAAVSEKPLEELDVRFRSTVVSCLISGRQLNIVLRIAHEMLTNAIKHRDPLTSMGIDLLVSDHAVRIRCVSTLPQDAIEEVLPGNGMRIMRGLCAMEGGRLRTRTEKGKFVIWARIPRIRQSPRRNV